MVTKDELKRKFSSGAMPDGDDFALLIDATQGEKGEDGQSFTFEDLTAEQIELLRGPQGLKGERGDDGRPFLFDDLTPEQHDLLKGLQGERGIQGPKGDKGDKGDKGERGEKGDKGNSGLIHTQSTNELKLWKGTATVVKDGRWTIDYSSAQFQSVISVIPTFSANANDSDPAGMQIGGGLINSTITNVGAQGYAVKGLAAGLLAAMTSTWASEGTTVHVTVIGH